MFLSDMEPIYESKIDANMRIFVVNFKSLFHVFIYLGICMCWNALFVICSHCSFALLK